MQYEVSIGTGQLSEASSQVNTIFCATSCTANKWPNVIYLFVDLAMASTLVTVQCNYALWSIRYIAALAAPKDTVSLVNR